MNKIILQGIKPSTIEKLKYLSKQHQRSIEEEITAILEDVTENISEDEPIITPENKGWQKGFFEEVIGGWKGKALTRESQPKQQERDFF